MIPKVEVNHSVPLDPPREMTRDERIKVLEFLNDRLLAIMLEMKADSEKRRQNK